MNSTRSFDDFNSGLIWADSKRRVNHYNQYLKTTLELNGVDDFTLSTIFSKASNIFIDSYVYPSLVGKHCIEEVQLTLLSRSGAHIPVVANIKMSADQSTCWSLFSCEKRDKLYQELIDAREILEKQESDLLELASTDPLTGLLNRRELCLRAEALLSSSNRNNSPLAVLVIDLDYFKKVNDSFGHIVGDTVLRNVSDLLGEGRRDIDVVARFGGEEFIVVLPDVTDVNAFKIANSIRERIGNYKHRNNINVTASIGVSENNPKKRETFEALVKKADRALYRAKEAGRNQVAI